MAAESFRERLREEVTCAVSLDLFAEPVLLDCGHNFCRACIAQSCGESPSRAACPQCREAVQAERLKPNRQLANVVELVKELSGLPRRAAAGDALCERHQEPLKLFCREDEALICVVCDRAKEHRAHLVVPAEEAAQECKDQISRSLESLRKQRENILLYKAENEKESQDLLKQVAAERERTASAFRRLRQFLEEQETLLQTQMEEEEEAIAERRDEHQARLSAELSSLDNLIRELEEKLQRSGNELLQNIRNILERCKKESFQNPVAFPAALKWRIQDFSDISPCLEGVMKQFKDSLLSGLELQEVKVTLDPDTAYPKLILSDDGKSARLGEKHQNLPDNPERFDCWPFVLGREGFTTGRHFWEVTLGSEGFWSVGVARKSVRRKGEVNTGPKEGIWDLGRGDLISVPPDHTSLALSQKLKIRVTLNCTGGRVTFFNADTGAQLYGYSDASFCGETLLPCFYLIGKARLELLS